MPKKKFYAVAVGRKTGIFKTWAECEKQTKGFSGARFKSFPSKSAAQEFIDGKSSTEPTQVDSKPKSKSAPSKPAEKKRPRPSVYPRMTIDVHFDGGSRGNPGTAGAGANIVVATETKDGEIRRKTIQVRKYIGTKATNNIAEYNGLLCGLEEARNAVKEFKVVSDGDGVCLFVRGDSDLVIRQINEHYQCKSKNLIPLLDNAKSLVAEMKRLAPMDVSFEHVYREDNSVADGLANEAMDSGKSWTTIEEEHSGNEEEGSGNEDQSTQGAVRDKDSETGNGAKRVRHETKSVPSSDTIEQATEYCDV